MSQSDSREQWDPERWQTCLKLARTLLMVGDDDSDLVLMYLDVRLKTFRYDEWRPDLPAPFGGSSGSAAYSLGRM